MFYYPRVFRPVLFFVSFYIVPVLRVFIQSYCFIVIRWYKAWPFYKAFFCKINYYSYRFILLRCNEFLFFFCKRFFYKISYCSYYFIDSEYYVLSWDCVLSLFCQVMLYYFSWFIQVFLTRFLINYLFIPFWYFFNQLKYFNLIFVQSHNRELQK